MTSLGNIGLQEFVRKDLKQIGSYGDWINRLPATMTTTAPGMNEDNVAEYLEGLRHEAFGLTFLEFMHAELAALTKQAPSMKKSELVNQLDAYIEMLGKGILKTNTQIRTYFGNLFDNFAIRPCDENSTKNAI